MKGVVRRALEGHQMSLETLRTLLLHKEEERVLQQLALLSDKRVTTALASLVEVMKD
jgi:3-oxoacyl-[acyl-carrier-protein] synthase III